MIEAPGRDAERVCTANQRWPTVMPQRQVSTTLATPHLSRGTQFRSCEAPAEADGPLRTSSLSYLLMAAESPDPANTRSPY